MAGDVKLKISLDAEEARRNAAAMKTGWDALNSSLNKPVNGDGVEQLGGDLAGAADSAADLVPELNAVAAAVQAVSRGAQRDSSGRFVSAARAAAAAGRDEAAASDAVAVAARTAAGRLDDMAGGSLAADKGFSGLIGTARTLGATLLAGIGSVSLAGLLVESVQAIASVSRLSTLAGASAEQFTRQAYAVRSVGVESEDYANILKDVNEKMGDYFAEGGGELQFFFDTLAPSVGRTADEFRGLSGPDALALYVQVLEEAGVSSAEMTTHMERLASDSTKLVPLLKDGSKGMRELGDEAERLGLVLDDETVARASAVQAEMRKIGATAEGAGTQLTASMLPALQDISEAMGWVTENTVAVDAAAGAAQFTLQTLALIVIALGTTFGNLGRLAGAAAAAAVSAARGDFAQAGEIMRLVEKDNEEATRKAEEAIVRIYSDAGQRKVAAAQVGAQGIGSIEQQRQIAAAKHATEMGKIKDKLVSDARASISELEGIEREGASRLEQAYAARQETEERYAAARAGLQRAGEPSLLKASGLQLQAQQALRAGDADGAKQAAQQALGVLQELQRAGGSTIGFEGMIDALEGIEKAADQLNVEQAASSLEELRKHIAELKAEADKLESTSVTVTMDAEAEAALVAQMQALAEKLGQTLTIPVKMVPTTADGTVTTDAATPDVKRRSGGWIDGVGSTTSDSILLAASRREFVVNAQAAAALPAGALEFINRTGTLPDLVSRQLPALQALPTPTAPAGTPLNLTLPGVGEYQLQGQPAEVDRLRRDIELASRQLGRRR